MYNAELQNLRLKDGPISLILKSLERGENTWADDLKEQGPEAQQIFN